jgi:hypothetical protein
MDATTLKLIDTPSTPLGVIVTGNSVSATNVEISDLTADCNYVSGNYHHEGIGLSGTQNAIRRVKVINLGGTGEAFGIVLANFFLPDSEGNIIEECEVSHYAGGDGSSAICLNGGGCLSDCGPGISGIIRNNRVFLPLNDGQHPTFAFNGSSMHDSLIEGNYVNGADDAFYGDTSGSTNIIIAQNVFMNVGHGISINGTTRNHITIEFNTISLTNPPGYNWIYAFGTWTSTGSIFTNITIIGNNVSWNSNGTGTASALNFYNATGILCVYNKIDARLGNYFGNCTGVVVDNNFDLVGNYRSDINNPTLGGTSIASAGINLMANPSVIVTNGSSQPVTFNTNVTINGTLNYSNMVARLLAGTGISTSTVNTSTGQVVTVNANAQTNSIIYDSFSITNTSATNWASLAVTSSNAVISVHGVNVGILQTNGIFNVPNGISSTVSNKLAAVTIASGVTSLNWTNTTPRNVVFYVQNLTGDVSYNGSTLFNNLIKSGATVILQPNEYVSVNITVGSGTSFTARWHPF